MGHGLAASLQALVKSVGAGGGRGRGRGRRNVPAAGKRTSSSVTALQRHARRLAAEREAEKRSAADHDAKVAAAKDAERRDAPPDMLLWDRYQPGRRTLVVGDGNLSFALAVAQRWADLAGPDDTDAALDGSSGGAGAGTEAEAEAPTRQGPAHELVATVYDSAEAVVAKYPEAAENAAALEALGATVAYGVDGTQLHTPVQMALHGCTAAGVIAFHFPHAGLGIKDQDRNIRENQKLLQGFFASAKAILASAPAAARVRKPKPRKGAGDDKDGDDDEPDHPDNRRVAKGPPGTVGPSGRDIGDGGGEVHVTVRRGAPYDAWQVVKLGRAAGFALINAVPFDPRAFPGYEHRRTLGAVEGVSRMHNEEILPKRCVTYIFQRAAAPVVASKKSKSA